MSASRGQQNVLDDVKLGARVLDRSLRMSRTSGLWRVVELLKANADDLGEFINSDGRGRFLPAYLEQLATALDDERQEQLGELEQLRRGVEQMEAALRGDAGHD